MPRRRLPTPSVAAPTFLVIVLAPPRRRLPTPLVVVATPTPTFLVIVLAGSKLARTIVALHGNPTDPTDLNLSSSLASPTQQLALALDEEAVDGLVVGNRLMEAGEYDLALRAYIRDAAADGFEPVHLLALGSANLALGRLGQAETQFREATEALPDEPVAWNNLGVVLMERAEYGEASQVFRRAFALDSGQSDSIRENLRLALARLENRAYTPPIDSNRYGLERRGGGRYLLIDSTIP